MVILNLAPYERCSIAALLQSGGVLSFQDHFNSRKREGSIDENQTTAHRFDLGPGADHGHDSCPMRPEP